ncbi:hypothetical protein [Streptomyces sp. NPDC048663]|uniref:hypothetical protein n=1 Tax=Streptomyces sp. NPDC048663 TaxID=3155638 RepID=UPI003415708B
MTTDPPPSPASPSEELWTVSAVAAYLGFMGESATGSAHKQLARRGITATSREPGRSGESLYLAAQVRAAHEGRPDPGLRGASRGEGGRFTTSTDT